MGVIGCGDDLSQGEGSVMVTIRGGVVLEVVDEKEVEIS